jgi:hypothetical protein
MQMYFLLLLLLANSYFLYYFLLEKILKKYFFIFNNNNYLKISKITNFNKKKFKILTNTWLTVLPSIFNVNTLWVDMTTRGKV